MARVPHFRIPLNLPHAGTLAARIAYHLRGTVLEEAQELQFLLTPYAATGENPAPEVAAGVIEKAAALARRIVDEIEARKIGHDRLGQAIRNLFECLTLGEEGATVSLRAGENPNSTLRPT